MSEMRSKDRWREYLISFYIPSLIYFFSSSSWFDITKTTVYANEYSAVVNVGSNSPDREKADKIELAILVTDDATQSGNNEAFSK